MSPLRLSRVHFPVEVLGPGRRVGIWVQGCTIGCPGCVSRDTWDPEGGRSVDVAELVGRVLALTEGQDLDGVTVTGGEPFEQPDALLDLVRALPTALEVGRARPVDVMVYSGMSPDVLEDRYPDVLGHIDVLVPAPYRARQAPGGRWRGSANQPLVPLTPLGRERLALAGDLDAHVQEMQLAVDDQVWMIGVPGPGDMRRLEAELGRRGVVLGGASWRP